MNKENGSLDNRIDKAKAEAEREVAETGETIDAQEAFAQLDKKYLG